MIARLGGKLVEKSPDGVVVDVGGIGYHVFVSLQSLAAIPAIGESVVLHTYTHVREDAIQLFGFGEPDERRLFLLLKEVAGIGPRLALNILSGRPVGEIHAAIREGDVTRLVSIPGVGKKTAERIVVELREKVAAMTLEPGGGKATGVHDEAVSALVNLGYRRPDADRAVENAQRSGFSALEDVLREALKGMAR